MDVHRALAFLVLLTCALGGTLSSAANDRAAPNSAQRNRRYALSEFLVPPPLPSLPQRGFPPGRTGRNASPRPVESLGYFSKFMNWLNPFGGGTALELPPPPPPESLHPPKFHQHPAPPPGPPPPGPPPAGPPQHGYNAPHPGVFDRPPVAQPPPPNGAYNKPPQHGKDKNCNPCNKVPWLPMSHGASGGAYLPPINQEGHIGLVSGEYLPPSNHDAHHGPAVAASQEVRVPDFFYAPPLSPGQNGEVPPIGPLPNPHLYPGPMPPLFKAEAFDYPSRANHPADGPRPAHETGQSQSVSTPNGSPNYSADLNLGIPQEGQAIFESHRVSAPSHTGSSNQGYDHFNSHTNGAQVDLFSSASHENNQGSPIRSNSNPNQEISASNNQDYDSSRINQFTGPGVSENFDRTNYGNHQEFDYSSGLNFQRTDQSALPPSAVGNNYAYNDGDISPSVGTVRDSHASGTDDFSNVENPIHFEESPLTDLTKTSESRTDSPSISSSPTAFLDHDGTSNTKTTLNYDSGTNPYQVQREINRFGPNDNYTTESNPLKDLFRINQNNEAKWSDIKGTASSAVDTGLQSPNSLFVAPQPQTVHSWSVVLSTTMRTSQDDVSLGNLGSNSESNGENDNSRQYGAKRNKQVQVIIPYTSQYTPIPFHSSYDNKANVERTQARKVPYSNAPSRDTYVSEESRSEIKVINPPESSTISAALNSLDDRSTANAVTTATEVSPDAAGTKKVNNSIDVHRLQKNIDNWTIQEYSRGTTFSTVLPSSPPRPYLQPSKKIPNEYFTTTESVEHANHLHDHEENVKSFALAGFSFNDIEDEGSNRFEESRIEPVHVEDPRNNKKSNATRPNEKNGLDASSKKEHENSWKDFPVSISPVDKERVYVVTPQTTTTIVAEQRRREEENKSSAKSSKKGSVVYSKSIKSKQDEFEKIERAYQVLPQAVNNLAVASTGPETLPLWGIMEHEEFASLGQDDEDNNDDESAGAPILYAGHSKVSRARR